MINLTTVDEHTCIRTTAACTC